MADFTNVQVKSSNSTVLIQKAQADYFGGKKQIVVTLGSSGKVYGQLKTTQYDVSSKEQDFGTVPCTSVEGPNGPWYFSIS
jgi:hypothetical protein